MNTPQNPSQPQNSLSRFALGKHRRKAVALVLVIAFIVLISALVLSFFSRVTTDLSSSRSYAEGINVRQLADNAVGVVMGQIRAATTVPNGCWASQPGMIRVYGSAGGQPSVNAYAFYKLYSSQDLIVSGNEISRFDPSLTNPATSAVPVEVPLGTGGWMQQPAYFTDLNQPVSIPNPNGGPTPVKRYPIFDPSVALIYNPGGRPATPAWKNPGGIEGCEIALAATDRTLNDAPMPVRWIYVLKDGTLTAPTPINGTASGTAGLVANWAAIGSDGQSVTGVPTQANPIVGRIAFWTDDESCKVNLNTAGGFIVDETKFNNYASSPMYNGAGPTTDPNPAFIAGSFWDTPRVQTWFDRGLNSNTPTAFRPGLSNAQPQQNEFQRYPGHPATTSLGLVFQYLLPSNTGFNSEKLYALAPRLNPGGSQSGTRRLDTKVNGALAVKAGYSAALPGANGNHLYASLDEFFYTTQNGLMTNGLRTSAVDGINAWVPTFNSNPNNTSDIFFVPQKPMVAGSITPQMVDQVRFCVTAGNRSPELNLFGRPRVTMWPVPTASREQLLQTYGIRNVSDDFIRFCSTIGGNANTAVQTLTRQGEFIFDRQDPYSPTTDFTLARNQQIFNYLHGLTTSQVPGFGGSFGQKYAGGSGGMDQILVEIFDYIRTINQKDASRDKTIDQLTKVNSLVNNQLKTAARYAPHALVIPTRATFNGTQVSGLGRYPTVSEASIVFYHAGYICEPLPGSDLEKKDLPGNGSARSPKSPNEVVIYDFAKIPVAPSYTDNNSLLKSAWAKANVRTWKGQLVRAFMIFGTYNPMQGYAPVDNFANISLVDTTPADVNAVNGLMPRYNYPDPNKGVYVHQLQINGAFAIQTPTTGAAIPLGIGGGVSTGLLTNNFTKTSGDTWGGRNFGGTEGFYHTIIDSIGNTPAKSNYYVFQTPCTDPVMDGIRVGWTEKSFTFKGGEMDMFVKYQDQVGHNVQIQKLSLTYPDGGSWPLPTPSYRQDVGGFDNRVNGYNATNASSWTPWGTFVSKYGMLGGWAMPYYLPTRIAWSQQNSGTPWPLLDQYGNQTGDGLNYTNRYLQILQPGDTIRSLIVGGGVNGAVPANADVRITALQQTVSTLQPHPEYQSATKHLVQKLRVGYGGFYFDPTVYAELPETTASPATGAFFPLGGSKYSTNYGPDLPPFTDANGKIPFVAVRSDGGAADFDTGIGNFPDGAFAGKADEGNVAQYWYDAVNKIYNFVEPYFSTWLYDSPLDTYFSPNRQVPGPVMFGSLPAPQSSWANAGWKTLLFCPNPAGANHPGAKTPPDHLLLDLFNMPVVQPYAISEPFSTAGKVNLNYPIVPFSYLKRTTALRAALQPLRVTAIPQTLVDGNKVFKYKGTDNQQNLRYLVDREETLKAFDAFFAQYTNNRNGGFFKCASQICERFLYPKGQTFDGSTVTYTAGEAQIQAFWARNQLTGDNVREKPYADLYPRITTKSNTFTVHYRVQTLRQRAYTGDPRGAVAYYRTFDESRDQIMSELRGQTTIERYLDPQDPRFQSTYQPATSQINAQTQSLETAYRFRIIANKRFSPW